LPLVGGPFFLWSSLSEPLHFNPNSLRVRYRTLDPHPMISSVDLGPTLLIYGFCGGEALFMMLCCPPTPSPSLGFYSSVPCISLVHFSSPTEAPPFLVITPLVLSLRLLAAVKSGSLKLLASFCRFLFFFPLGWSCLPFLYPSNLPTSARFMLISPIQSSTLHCSLFPRVLLVSEFVCLIFFIFRFSSQRLLYSSRS